MPDGGISALVDAGNHQCVRLFREEDQSVGEAVEKAGASFAVDSLAPERVLSNSAEARAYLCAEASSGPGAALVIPVGGFSDFLARFRENHKAPAHPYRRSSSSMNSSAGRPEEGFTR